MPFILNQTSHAVGTPQIAKQHQSIHRTMQAAKMQAFEFHLKTIRKHNLATKLLQRLDSSKQTQMTTDIDSVIFDIRVLCQTLSSSYVQSTINKLLDEIGFAVKTQIKDLPPMTLFEAVTHECFDSASVDGKYFSSVHFERCELSDVSTLNLLKHDNATRLEYNFTQEELLEAEYDSDRKEWLVSGHRLHLFSSQSVI
ncbi:hypothetical protein F7U66_02045 [Vibrio parahaemolyticus]|nr:hypothetical protein [Vibrio parahaemolyticus]